jgi:hypothetical protein
MVVPLKFCPADSITKYHLVLYCERCFECHALCSKVPVACKYLDEELRVIDDTAASAD